MRKELFINLVTTRPPFLEYCNSSSGPGTDIRSGEAGGGVSPFPKYVSNLYVVQWSSEFAPWPLS